MVIGNNSITNAYIRVGWTVTSDKRDKTDIKDLNYGLDFVKGLRPVSFLRNDRSNYQEQEQEQKDKNTNRELGFLAQDVIELEKKFGAKSNNLLIADDEQKERLKIQETAFIPVLVKAIQELTQENEALKSRIEALEKGDSDL